jgi:adenosylcobinamide-GDP ribazoletransferase
MLSGLRLAVTLLTIVPVSRRGAPERLGGARRAMLWAPLVGLLLGAVAAGVMLLAELAGQRPLLCATLGVATLAGLSRGLHLDGLADTADGLGSRRPPPEALAVMRQGDTGPFGVVSVVLVLLIQVTAAAEAGPLGLLAAATVGRLAITWSCRRGVPPARPDGLGALVASSVSPVLAAFFSLVLLLAAVALGPTGALGVVGGLAAGELVLARCRKRLGGVTGDVLGAVCEVAVATSLLIFAAG